MKRNQRYFYLAMGIAAMLIFTASCAPSGGKSGEEMNYIGKDLAFTFDVKMTDTVVQCSATVTNIGEEELIFYSDDALATILFYDKKWDYYNPFELNQYFAAVREAWKLEPGGSGSFTLEAPLEGFVPGEYHAEAEFDIVFQEGSGREGFILKQSKKFTIP